MATILKVNDKSKSAKLFLAYVRTLSFVTVKEEKSPYDPEFVKKIKRAEKRGDYTEVDVNDVWGSLGLK